MNNTTRKTTPRFDGVDATYRSDAPRAGVANLEDENARKVNRKYAHGSCTHLLSRRKRYSTGGRGEMGDLKWIKQTNALRQNFVGAGGGLSVAQFSTGLVQCRLE